ncbi:MAG: response regulator [Campylobacterota bacterium]|nr:response regulator [Campylobacterota bacterium]
MNNYTILYAEDEEQTRLNYTNYLEKYFKNVYSVGDGVEALKVYKENKPDILLLDINMPKIDGLKVAKTIREKDKTTRIIILTAHLEQDKLLFAAELNLTKYLPKPISRNELKIALQKASDEIKELNENQDTTYLNSDCIWNKKTKKLIHKEKEIKLTKYEILLLELLSSKKDRVFTLDEISLYLWNDIEDLEINTNKLKDIIKRIRKKLPINSIENIYGAGYKLKRVKI